MHTICSEWTNEHMQVRTETFSLNCGAHSASAFLHVTSCTLSNQLDSPKSTAVVWAMQGKSASDAYLVGLSGQPPK